MPHAALTATRRTPITARSRALAHYRVEELAATVLADLATDWGRAPDGVMLGNCTGPGGNLGRNVALAAGFGGSCVGWGIDVQCGSGLAAVQQAAHQVAATGTTIFAGGAESASTAPTRSYSGVPFDRAPFAPQGFPDPDMIEAADALARITRISRERQEGYAVRSHRLALASEHHRWAETSWMVGNDRAARVVDDGPRRLTSESLRRFSPIIDVENATVTPGTTARISDGAAGVVVAPLESTDGPHWRIIASTLTGGDPAVPGLAPVEATQQALAHAGLAMDDMDVIEVVEAFAAQVIAFLEPFHLATGDAIDPRVNARGGAIALGHPWGASGAIALGTLMNRLSEAGPGARGLTTCAIGGGMGATMILEYNA
jgi:acetyl-CoA C-acetyltransferase